VNNAKKVFGGDFDGTPNQVPYVMKAILEYFDVHGIKIEGLFRISGTLSEITHLIEEFNRGRNFETFILIFNQKVNNENQL
jgi:hypothetical protein